MYFNELDLPGGRIFEAIFLIVLAFFLAKNVFESLLNSIVNKDFKSLKFFIFSAIMVLVFFYDKPKWDFLFTVVWFLSIIYLLYKGCNTGCNFFDKKTHAEYKKQIINDNNKNDIKNKTEQYSSKSKVQKKVIVIKDGLQSELPKIITYCPKCNTSIYVPADRPVEVLCQNCKCKFKHPYEK